MQLCAYEVMSMPISKSRLSEFFCGDQTVALGYSKFCGIFTEEEWEGFEYAYVVVLSWPSSTHVIEQAGFVFLVLADLRKHRQHT